MMANGRVEMEQRAAWNHTAHLLCKLHNVNCARSSQMREPGDFNPYKAKKTVAELDDDAKAKLREAFNRG